MATPLLILFTERSVVRFAVRIKELLAALLPRRFEFGRCDVPVRPTFLSLDPHRGTFLMSRDSPYEPRTGANFSAFCTPSGNPTLTFIIRAGTILCAAKTPPKSCSIEHVWGGYEAPCLRLCSLQKESFPVPQQRNYAAHCATAGKLSAFRMRCTSSHPLAAAVRHCAFNYEPEIFSLCISSATAESVRAC
jgi:hypothetical protein